MDSKMKKKFFLAVCSFFLVSCQPSTLASCYQCYYGNRLVSNVLVPFQFIQGKTCEKDLNEALPLDYSFDRRVLNSQHDYSSFQSTRIWKNNRPDKVSIEDKDRAVYFFVQIPKGYHAFKRNNVQNQDIYGKKILLTDNFFFYHSREELSILYVDIVKDENAKEDSVFSFYYILPDSCEDKRTLSDIRVFLSDKQAKEPQEN